MPRKVKYGDDYDDYDDDYSDYEYYDDDYDVDDNVGEAPESKRGTNGTGIWRCSICTYDNDESMSACDICGVIRNPMVTDISNSEKRTASSICKDSGVSTMARSLFSPLPHRTPEKAVIGQWQKDDSVNKGAAFKFDVPSPDDLVSRGLCSSKAGSKANILSLKSPKVPSGIAEKSSAVNAKSTVKRFDGSSFLTAKGEQGNMDESKVTTDSLSASMPKGKHKSVDDGISSSVNGDKPSCATSSFNNMSLSDESGKSNDVNSRTAKSLIQYKPDKWMLPDKTEDKLTQLNLAIVGHVDSGKSTLSGRLLHLLGRITQKEMHKYEKEAKIQGKGSFAFAWALDESPEERERGITMTVAVAYFDSDKYHVVLLDSPGHKDFVPNMISGATQADAAVLVIDASSGAFEAGMDATKGQTREHAQLIRSFGVDQLIVAVNKMDAVQYSKDRFDFIRIQLGTFLRSCQFKDSSVSWIPLSAMENQNLIGAPSDVHFTSWYHGPNLLNAIDSLQPPTRDFSKPLLMPICDVVRSSSLGQVLACGKLEAGALRNGLKVLVMPSGEVGTVRSLERDSQACTVARVGDNVSVSLVGIDAIHVIAGGVLCHPDFPAAVAKHLELKLLVLDVATPILIGSQLEFHIHHAKEAARVKRIVSLLDPKTGKVTKKAPRCLTSKQSAVIEVVLNGSVCVEEFSRSRALGRVFLRALGRTLAVGVVTRIIE